MFFVAHVEVSINVGGGRNGRVPEEFGHLNQFGSIAEKDACEGMAKIVEPNVAQSVLFKQESVVLCHIIRSKELTELVGADEVIVLSVVAAFEHLFVQFLAFLYSGPMSARMRFFISPAALLVNVTHKILAESMPYS